MTKKEWDELDEVQQYDYLILKSFKWLMFCAVGYLICQIILLIIHFLK